MEAVVVKLGVGNTASVLFALERAGARAVLTDDPTIIADAPRLILPGVGAAGHAMRMLQQKGLIETLRTYERPLLGICLGQQLLYETSEEYDGETTLGLISGVVRRFAADAKRPVPHMGWSKLSFTRESPLTEGLKDGDYAYFVHSYYCPVGAETLAAVEYGETFSAIVGKDHAFGCQFHPERSGAVGARVLSNFLKLPC